MSASFLLNCRCGAVDARRNVEFQRNLGLEDHHHRIGGLASGFHFAPHLRRDGRDNVGERGPPLEEEIGAHAPQDRGWWELSRVL